MVPVALALGVVVAAVVGVPDTVGEVVGDADEEDDALSVGVAEVELEADDDGVGVGVGLGVGVGVGVGVADALREPSPGTDVPEESLELVPPV